MNKEQIMWALNQENIMRKMHDETLDGLIGCLDNEYRQNYPYPFAEKPQSIITKSPVFRAVIDMFLANLIHHFAKDLIEIIVDIIIKYEDQLKE